MAAKPPQKRKKLSPIIFQPPNDPALTVEVQQLDEIQPVGVQQVQQQQEQAEPEPAQPVVDAQPEAEQVSDTSEIQTMKQKNQELDDQIQEMQQKMLEKEKKAAKKLKMKQREHEQQVLLKEKMARLDQLKEQKEKLKAKISKDKEEMEAAHKAKISKIENQQNQVSLETFLDDNQDFEEQLRIMNVELSTAQIKTYTLRRQQINNTLSDCRLSVNNNQYGCAVAAITAGKQRAIIGVPPGKGKSRIIAAIIALKARFSNTEHFTIVYSTELLMSVDSVNIKKLEAYLGKGKDIAQVVYNPAESLENQVYEESFVLIDEADTILLDHAATLPNKNVIGLSATVVNQDLKTELEFLNHTGFVFMDSGISGYIDPNTCTTKCSVDKFFTQNKQFAKLIYATGDAFTAFRSQYKGKSIMNCKSTAYLRQLNKEDVLLVEDAELMRGVDYRPAKGTKGIALLVMAKFKSNRAYIQALGRVGRFNDTCQRHTWQDLDYPVDEIEEMKILSKLRETISQLKRSSGAIQRLGLRQQALLSYNKQK